MKVKDAIKALQELGQDEELFMFFKTPDGGLNFSSDISTITKGAVYDKYGRLVTGVLIMKEIVK